MIDYKNMLISLDQIDDMRHAIGYEPTQMRRGQRCFKFMRNYFFCSQPSPTWEDLCKHGLAGATPRSEREIIYYVSADGLKALEYIYKVRFEEGR